MILQSIKSMKEKYREERLLIQTSGLHNPERTVKRQVRCGWEGLPPVFFSDSCFMKEAFPQALFLWGEVEGRTGNGEKGSESTQNPEFYLSRPYWTWEVYGTNPGYI